MKPNAKEVGARIRSLRKQKGFTMERFGLEIGDAHKSLVSKWERGANIPNPVRLKSISDLTGVSVDELIYGKQSELQKYSTKQLLEELERRTHRDGNSN